MSELEKKIAEIARKRAGVYVDKAAHPEFANVILVTAANHAYISVYHNWACNAEKHGLNWAVLANDDKAYDALGPDRALPTSGTKVSGMNGWGSAKLDDVGRNKMMIVLQIMTLTGLDVVFSDADNMFRGDVFAKGASLGDLIRSNKYDYIYEEELAKAPAKGHVVPGDGGNTGFFYMSPRRKPHMLKFQAHVIAEVDRIREKSFKKSGERLGADQPIFWQVMQNLRGSGGKNGPWGFRCVHLCNANPTCKAPPEETLDYCSMDAFQHPTGWDSPPKELVSYHANYASNEAKIAKLQKAGVWGAWDEKTKKCKGSPAVASTTPPPQPSVTVQAAAASSAAPSVTFAQECLRLTTPTIELAYPADAEAHFEEVRKALSPWMDFAKKQFMKDMKNPYHCGEGYCGPWIENLWIKHFLEGLWEKKNSWHSSI
eukprot:TRINITY_DN10939_c2_g1_i1.p1 TRINITY_DN10939_c2_g1~~TRINITY_DN10939_c2_g1_i1.p1  ORF type:complete len:429 (+),score=88.92 TRINITY_DN10939_c2_g1_i1:133-1419(+)